jgi:DNA gyrase inhibitor GyrI
MKTPDVRIVRLEPMRVASAYGFGTSPEEAAWQTLAGWAKPKGFLDNLTEHPLFGFNNPYPTPDNPNYGYEFWIRVGSDVEPGGGVRIGEFFGGTYAVTRCEVRGNPGSTVPPAWQSLVQWCKDHQRTLGQHHALEGFLTLPDDLNRLVLNLYCPILS